MGHLTLELLLWMASAFFVGCVIGCLARQVLSRPPREAPAAVEIPKPAEAPASSPPPAAAAKEDGPAAAPVQAEPEEEPEKPQAGPAPAEADAEPKPEPEQARPATGKPRRPKGLARAREAGPDNLQRISGIGPKLEKTLHGLGFFHYDQVAAWTPDEVEWVNEHLRFRGRIEREEWLEQCRLLAAGDEAAFTERYGKAKAAGNGNGNGNGAKRSA